MSSAASFTGANSPRYPAPDVARGFMLLLIAVANVPVWLMFFPVQSEPGLADRWWILMRGLLVDHRAYPLFSILFGFGLMTMVIRRTCAHVGARSTELALQMPDLPLAVREQWLAGFTVEAQADARRLVRRRGFWMLIFGLVHSLLFFGDIIGTYALIAIIFAGLIVKKRFKVMAIIGGVQIILMLVFMVAGQMMFELFPGLQGGSGVGGLNIMLHWYYPLVSFGQWVVSTIMTALISIVVPCTFLGAWVATTDVMKTPQRYRGLLIGLGVGGLALASLLGAPESLHEAGMLSWWMPGAGALHEFSGLFGAIGWLALLTLFAGPARESLSGAHRFLSAIGKRSMTAYIGQSILFALIFAVMGLSGVRSVTPLQGLGIAIGVWVVLALFCQVLEARGYKRGPLEVLLRRAVAKSARPHPLPPIPTVLLAHELMENEAEAGDSAEGREASAAVGAVAEEAASAETTG